MDREVSGAFKALGNPHRVRIMEWLRDRALACGAGERVEDCALDPASCNAGELLSAVGVGRSTLSHHLKELEHAGLIQRERAGRYVYVRLNDERVAALRGFLAGGAERDAPGGDVPIACTLSGEEAEAWRAAVPELLSELEEVRELEDGIAFRYDGAVDWRRRLERLTEFIQGERECCAFFRFEVIVEPGEGPIWLRLRGRPGVKEYFAGELVELGLEMPGSKKEAP